MKLPHPIQFGACLIAALFAIELHAEPAQTVPLAREGHSLFSIVVSHGVFPSAEAASAASDQVDWFGKDGSAMTTCTESFAATELRHYLCALTGLDENDPSQFPIRNDQENTGRNVILLGSEENHSNRRLAPFRHELGQMTGGDFGPEAFRIRTVHQNDGVKVLLDGFDRVGTLYSVYEFLGHCGVRWFSPGLSGEVVPSKPNLVLPEINELDGPKFAIRGFWAEFFNSENEFVRPVGKKGTIEFFNWMARNRLNLWSSGEQGVPPGEMKKRGLHLSAGGHTFYTLIAPDAPYPYRHSKFQSSKPSDAPADPYSISPDFKGDVNGDGMLSNSEAHPEWYGLGPDGKRHFTTDPFGYNFCTSNADMRTEFLKALIEKLSKGEWKFADYLDWWSEDADNWCGCDDCKKLGSPTDRNLIMAHFIREELKKALADGRLSRDIKVKFLIYRSAGVIDPPTHPLPEGFDYEGIMGTFFPIYRCYVHGIDDPDCAEFNQQYFKYLNAWRTSPYYKGKFMIGEYYNISYFRDLPILFTKSMARDIRFYYESGARAMHYMHVPMGNWGPRTLTNYQFARMLWNPFVDVPAMLDDYFQQRYENAHGLMSEFYASLEKAMLNVPEYVATPGEDENLGGQLRAFAEGKTKELFPYRHLRMSGDHPDPDQAPSIEDTLKELDQTERLMNQALQVNVSERARACILEDEALYRYANATVRLYYHLARSTQFKLKSPEWVREMKAATLQADFLDRHPIAYVAVYGGTQNMTRNALECTGVKEVYLKWKAMMP